MIAVYDDAGREIVLHAPARRIVSLVPSLTETLFTLGCGDAVVGATRYCTEPAGSVERVERVGGTKNPDHARIGALHPDLVLVNQEENRKEDFEALQQAGLNVFVSFSHRVGDVPALIRMLGEMTDSAVSAGRLAAELETTLAELRLPDDARRPRVFCPIWKNPWMSFNRGTYADDMLWIAGGRNVCRECAERYCIVRLDEIAATAPEIMLLPDEPYVFRTQDLPALAPLSGTPAHRANNIHFIDGKALSWYGTRTAPGLRYLRKLLVE